MRNSIVMLMTALLLASVRVFKDLRTNNSLIVSSEDFVISGYCAGTFIHPELKSDVAWHADESQVTFENAAPKPSIPIMPIYMCHIITGLNQGAVVLTSERIE